MQAYKGTTLSGGIEIGPCFQFGHVALEFRRYRPEDAAKEWFRFEDALSEAEKKMTAAYEQAAAGLGAEEAAIFGAHLTILRDPELLAGV